MPQPGPATDWQENIRSDEASRFAGYARDIEDLQRWHAERTGGTIRRGFHTKPHAGLRGVFTIRSDIPDYARHGIFRTPASRPAWVRFSSGFSRPQPDLFPDVRGLAVKVVGVEGPMLLPGEEAARTQDFIAINQPSQPARDADEFTAIALASKDLLTAPVALAQSLGPLRAAQISASALSLVRPVRSLAGEHYWSNTPMKLGPYAVKFLWRPRCPPGDGLLLPGASRLRLEFASRLAREDVIFDFAVQFFVDAARTPIEDGSQEWDPETAPWVTVARLQMDRRDLTLEPSQREEEYVQRLSFNPWHAPEAHRPLGDIQRLRRVVYLASARLRGHIPEIEVAETA